MSFKKVGYWCSVILPILDFIKLFIKDVTIFQDNRRYLEELEEFNFSVSNGVVRERRKKK